MHLVVRAHRVLAIRPNHRSSMKIKCIKQQQSLCQRIRSIHSLRYVLPSEFHSKCATLFLFFINFFHKKKKNVSVVDVVSYSVRFAFSIFNVEVFFFLILTINVNAYYICVPHHTSSRLESHNNNKIHITQNNNNNRKRNKPFAL